MKAQRVYIDTSVLGGSFDPEFARSSNALKPEMIATTPDALTLADAYQRGRPGRH